MATAGPWDVLYAGGASFLLSRGTSGNTGFLLLRDLRGQHTVDGAAATACVSGQVDFGSLRATTMLGVAAQRREGTASQVCTLWTYFGPLVGDRAVSVVADVGGTIYMVVASAPAAEWASLLPEFEAMIASLALESSG